MPLHPWYPAATLISIPRLIWLLERAGFCPALLDLHRNECTRIGRHVPAAATTDEHLMFMHVGCGANSSASTLSTGGRNQAALGIGADGGVPFLVLPRLCSGPMARLCPRLEGRPVLEHRQSHGPPGKERWCNGVQAADRKYCASVQGKLIPSQGTSWKTAVILMEKLMWPRRIPNTLHVPRCPCQQAASVRSWEGLSTRGSEPATKAPFEFPVLCFLGTEELACEFLSQDDAGWWCLVFSSPLSLLLTHLLLSLVCLRAMYSFLLGGTVYFLAVLYFLHFLHIFSLFC